MVYYDIQLTLINIVSLWQQKFDSYDLRVKFFVDSKPAHWIMTIKERSDVKTWVEDYTRPIDDIFIPNFYGLLSFYHIKIEKLDINRPFFSISKNEKMTSQFFDILSGHPREAKRAQKGLVSSVSTRVMGIFLICLLLTTLLNKIFAFFNFLVWAFIYIRFNGCMQILGLLSDKTWIL